MHGSNSLLHISDLGVKFSLDFYKSGTVRDKFVSLLSSPLTIFTDNPTPHWAIRNINFIVERNDRVAILGKNGAGKTTLCRAISSMIYPTEGKIKTFGTIRSIFNASVGILPELTGRENMELLSMFIYPSLDRLQRAELLNEVISFAEIGAMIDTPFQHYSKGMQTRLFLSLISAAPADIILLDEVFDGADIFFQKRVLQRFYNLLEKSGATLFVSHSLDQVKATCNRAIVLDHGRIVFNGGTSDAIRFYQDMP